MKIQKRTNIGKNVRSIEQLMNLEKKIWSRRVRNRLPVRKTWHYVPAGTSCGCWPHDCSCRV